MDLTLPKPCPLRQGNPEVGNSSLPFPGGYFQRPTQLLGTVLEISQTGTIATFPTSLIEPAAVVLQMKPEFLILPTQPDFDRICLAVPEGIVGKFFQDRDDTPGPIHGRGTGGRFAFGENLMGKALEQSLGNGFHTVCQLLP